MEEKEFDYINVIPLVDVMLVLLTIVLTTSTFIATGSIPVELPRASRNNEQAIKTQTIEIGRDGGLYLNSRALPLAALTEAMKEMNRESPVLIRADRDLNLQIFVDVLEAVKNLGFRKVGLQTEDKK